MGEWGNGGWTVEGIPSIDPDLDDFHAAWHWLYEHPYFHYTRWPGESGFKEGLYLMVMKVDPETRRFEDDRSRNTHTEIWLENGPYVDEDGRDQHCHDIELDCGGDTFEEAICNMAKEVMEQQGDYPEWHLCSHCLKSHPAGPVEWPWFHSPECGEHGEAKMVTEPVEGREGVQRLVPLSEIFDCEHFPSD